MDDFNIENIGHDSEKKDPNPRREPDFVMCCAYLYLANITVDNLGNAMEKITSMTVLQKSRWILQLLPDHSREVDGTSLIL